MPQPATGQFDPLSLSSGEVPLGPPAGTNAPESLSDQPVDSAPSERDEPEPIDSELVQQTRLQIRSLVQEIVALCVSPVDLAEFYDGYLSRVVSALAGVAGAYWAVGDQGRLELEYQINLPQVGLSTEAQQTRHSLLLRRVVEQGQPQLVAPHAGEADEAGAGNPTDYLLVLAPLIVEGQTIAVVEVFQRATGGPTTQRGYLRFLVQMAQHAVDFLKNRQLRNYGDQQAWWKQLELFSRQVHSSLDPLACCFAIANQGRSLIECDRVAVATPRGRHFEIASVSGLDQVQRRSRAVKLLAELVRVVAQAGEPLWHTGGEEEHSPQIEKALQAYLDETHSKAIGILPLGQSEEEEDDAPKEQQHQAAAPCGVLVVEQLGKTPLPQEAEARSTAVARHASLALTNAQQHDGLFLLPLWQAMGKSRMLLSARTIPKTLLAFGLVAACVCTLLLVPADFAVEGRGELQPQQRQAIFARIGGLVVDVPVDHLEAIEEGSLLARISNTEVEAALAELLGKRTETEEQLSGLERTLLSGGRRSPEEQAQLEGQKLQARMTLRSIDQQIELYTQKQQDQYVTSPFPGQVITWQARETLLHRTVQPGQVLMTVADPQQAWELEIQLPENRVGHLLQTSGKSNDPVLVDFILATHPGRTYTGEVIAISPRADLDPQQQGTVTVRVAINKEELPELRPGATVTARIACGERSLGYVWFHDAWEFVQSRILFRF